MDKTVATAQEAVADIVAGSTIVVGGFGLCGIPSVLFEALLRSDADDLEVFRTTPVWKTRALVCCWPPAGCAGSSPRMWARTESSPASFSRGSSRLS